MVEPRADLSVRVSPGAATAVAEDGIEGTVAIDRAADGRYEVTLTQGRTQLSLRIIEVDDGSCRAGSGSPSSS